MFGYVLQPPSGLPKTLWACQTKVNDYTWVNRAHPDTIEFSICTASERTVRRDGSAPVKLSGTVFSCVVGDIGVRSEAPSGVTVEISSVAVRFPTLSAVAKELEESDFSDPSVLILPAILEDLSDRERLSLDRLLHRYIQSYVEQDAGSQLACYALIFELLSTLDKILRGRSQTAKRKKDKYVNYYVMKTDAIIAQSYTRHLTLQMIAEELGITPSYLSAIYKQTRGICFSERLCAVRVEKARDLLTETTLSSAQIAEQVGFCDESNLRKRFKQYFGVGIREYRNIAKEQTLYHPKPERGI